MAKYVGKIATSSGIGVSGAHGYGDLIFATGTNQFSPISANSGTGIQFLSQTGNGTTAGAPAWYTISKSTIALGNVEDTALSTWTGNTYLQIASTQVTGLMATSQGGLGVSAASGITGNFVFAGPESGTGSASFRLLVEADIPNLSTDKLTTGTLSSDRLPVATQSSLGLIIAGTGTTINSGTLSVTSSNIVASLGYTPYATTGGTVSGSLIVTGTAALSSTLSVSGNTTLSGALSVSGLSSLAAVTTTGVVNANSLNVSGNTSVTGTLSVSGVSTLRGNVSALGTMSVSGNSTLSGTLSVSGLSSLAAVTTTGVVNANSLNVSGNTSVTGTLSVSGVSTLRGNVSALADLTVSGNSTLSGTLGVSGQVTVQTSTAETARLASSASHVYIGFYPSGIANTREAYFGFGSNANRNLTIANESTTGNIGLVTAGVSRLFITSGGLVGVGTASPGSGLDVNVNAVFRSGITVSGLSSLNTLTTTGVTNLNSLNVSGNTLLTGTLGVGGATLTATHASGAFPDISPEVEILGGTAAGTYDESVIIRHSAVDATAVSRRLSLLFKHSSEGSSTESNKVTGLLSETSSSWANNPRLSIVSDGAKRMQFSASTVDVYLGLSVSGNSTLSGTLGVSGLSSLAAVTTTGVVNANSLNVSGNTSITGTLGVSGASTLRGNVSALADFTASGNSTLSGTLSVSGVSTLRGNVSALGTMSVSGNSTLSGTLGVSGLSSLAAVTTTGVVNANSLNVSGNTSITGTLGVSGLSSLAAVTTTGVVNANSLNVSGNTSVTGTLGVSGASTLRGNADFLGNVTISGTLSYSGLTVSGNTSSISNLEISGSSLLSEVIIDEASTNILRYSQDFNQSTVWLPNTMIVNNYSDTLPDGTFGTSQYLLGTSSNSYIRQTGVAVSASTTYTLSVWLKAFGSSNTVSLSLIDASGTSTTSCSVTTTAWQRFTVSRTLPVGITTVTAQIGGNNTIASGEQIYAWGAQLESKSFPTSYLVTTTGSTSGGTALTTGFPFNRYVSLNQVSSLSVSGTSYFTGSVRMYAASSAYDAFTVSGDTYLAMLDSTKKVGINTFAPASGLDVNNNAVFRSGVTISGATSLSGTMTQRGAATFLNTLTLSGSVLSLVSGASLNGSSTLDSNNEKLYSLSGYWGSAGGISSYMGTTLEILHNPSPGSLTAGSSVIQTGVAVSLNLETGTSLYNELNIAVASRAIGTSSANSRVAHTSAFSGISFYAASPLATTKTGTSTGQIYSYGLYIDTQKTGIVSGGYGVYQVGTADSNYFAGPTTVKILTHGLTTHSSNNATIPTSNRVHVFTTTAGVTGAYLPALSSITSGTEFVFVNPNTGTVVVYTTGTDKILGGGVGNYTSLSIAGLRSATFLAGVSGSTATWVLTTYY